MDIWSNHMCLFIDRLDIDSTVCMRLTSITRECEDFLIFQIIEAVFDYLATNERREKANSYRVWFNAQLMLNHRVN